MRQLLIKISILAISAGTLVVAGPATTGHAVSKERVTTVWLLVNRHCAAGESEAGRACFDPTGHASDYQFVAEDEAVSTAAHGEQQDYEYKVPSTIAAGEDNIVHLHAKVYNVTNGGAHARFCVGGAFEHHGTGEACATTNEASNGQSLEADHNVHLIPYDAGPGTVVTVTVGFEEPGGHVNFDYKATSHKTTINYRFTSSTKNPNHSLVRSMDLDGKGSFDVIGPLRDDMASASEDGSAKVVIVSETGKVRSAHLDLTRATYTDPGKAELSFRVVKSHLACMHVGRQLEVRALNHDDLRFNVCNLNQNTEDDVDVHVTVA